jgi:hypothetical protein
LGATSGPVALTTPNGTSNGVAFTVIPSAPFISSFTPHNGPVGTVVTLTGSNFLNATNVSFNGTPASFNVVDGTTATAVVPAGATSGFITLTTSAGTAPTPSVFTLPTPPPTLTNLSVTSGLVGTAVTLTGTNFSPLTGIAFNGVPAVSFSLLNSTTATANVPAGATTGNVTLTTPTGTSNGLPFTVIPSAPFISSFTPHSGPIGTVLTVTGSNLTGITSIVFSGATATVFNAVNATTATVTVPAGTTTGVFNLSTPGGTAGSTFPFTVVAAPTLASLNPTSGLVGTVVTLTGTNFTGATGVSFNGTAALTFGVTNATTATATVPAGATTGSVTITTPGGTSNGVLFTVTPPTFPDLVISTPSQPVAAGTYNSITVTGTGAGTLQGAVVVNSFVTVQSGGVLSTNCQPLSGPATFTLDAGATLIICAPDGISLSGATGAVQTSGARSFSADASYVYNGAGAQDTGDGLPATVRNLTVSTPAGLGLTLTALAIRQRLRLTSAGDLALHGRPLTLLSDASGTALIANEGTGVVQGSTGTMQRYIDAAGNTGPSGYRHYSAPVSGSTVADLATTATGGSFTPVVNPAYNTATSPNLLTPYPTVYGYNEAFQAASPATTVSEFDKGYFSPASLSSSLAVGRGYTVQLGNTEKVDFTGTFTTGTRLISGLSRGSGPTAGWHLVGNPYPSPLDWGSVGAPNTNGSGLSGVDAAAYVFQSTGPYTGQYRAFVNGIGAGSSLMAAGQGFFVRASTPGVPGTITLTDANRVTTFGATQPALQRGTATTRPLVRLSLALGNQPATTATAQDETFLYFETGATAHFDGAFDAHKLANPSPYYLATETQGASPVGLSIDGRALLTAGQADTVVPLWLSAPAGTYTLTATELVNFASLAGGTTVFLRDALTGTLTNLALTPSYTFSVAAGAAYNGRFALVFRAATVLAVQPAKGLSQAVATLYPNPVGTAATATVAVTGLPATVRQIDALLCNTLGQVVARYTLPVAQGAARTDVSTTGLSAGVYLLRLTTRTAEGQPAGALPAQRLTVQ